MSPVTRQTGPLSQGALPWPMSLEFWLSEAVTSTGDPPLPQPQISELTSELTDERNTGESASQLLDAETAERLRTEKEMKELQVRWRWRRRASDRHTLLALPKPLGTSPTGSAPLSAWGKRVAAALGHWVGQARRGGLARLTGCLRQTQYDALKKQMEVMEMEVMEARLIRAAEINGEVEDEDAGACGLKGGGGRNGTPRCLPIPGEPHTLSSLVSPLGAVLILK